MIKLTDDVYVAADAVAAVEMISDRTRDRIRVTMKGRPDDVHWIEPQFGVGDLRKTLNRIVNEIDTQLTIQNRGDDT